MLRSATRSVHADLEARLKLGQVTHDDRGERAREVYRDYCAAMLGWIDEVEPRLWHASWPAEMDVASRQRKREWLRADLSDLGVPIDAVPRCDTLPPLTSRAARYGVAYVIEGSQLGGQVLTKRLGPALSPHRPRYLEGHGAHTGAYWKSFLACLAHEVVHDDDIAEASTAAHTTFVALDAWFTARGVAERCPS